VYKRKKRKNILSYIKIKNKQCRFVFCLLRQPLCFCLLVWFLNKRRSVLHLLRLRALAIFLCLSTTSQHLFFLCQHLHLLISTTSQHLLCASLSMTFLSTSLDFHCAFRCVFVFVCINTQVQFLFGKLGLFSHEYNLGFCLVLVNLFEFMVNLFELG